MTGPGDLPVHRTLLTRRVSEAAYLTAENAYRYRPILRYFYTQHTAHRFWLTVAEVRDHIRAYFDPEYSDDQCEQDLAALVGWNNLMAEQEKSRARTVEEFLRRRLRYQLTPYSIAFERLLTELEQAHGTRGSLDASLLDILWDRLDALHHLVARGVPAQPDQGYLQQVRRLWLEAFGAFERIVNDANDYLAEMHRSRPDDLNRMEAFLAYKDVLIQYLSGFVNQLMDTAEKVRGLLAVWRRQRLAPVLLELLVGHDAAYLPGPDGQLPDPAVVRRHYAQQQEALAEWFRRGGGSDILRRVTADAIELVVRQTQRLMDRRRMGISRQRDLEQLARAFAACRALADAHRLAAVALGCALPRHVLGSAERFLMRDAGSVWEQEPDPVPLKRIQRGGRTRGAPAPIRDRQWEQQMVLLAELERRQQEAALWDRIFRGGEVDLGSLWVADPEVRVRLLEVLGRCLAAPDRTALASDGSPIRLLDPTPPGSYGEVVGPDGVLHTPRFRLRRGVTS